MLRFATNLVWPCDSSAERTRRSSSKILLLAVTGSTLLILLASCKSTLESTPSDGPEDGIAGTRLQGPAADPGPKFGIQRSGIAVRLWTLPPSARLPDRLLQIFDQPRAAGDASEAAEPWRQRGFLAATISLADVQQLEQALATLPTNPSPSRPVAQSRAASNTAGPQQAPARRASSEAAAQSSTDEPELSLEAATRRAQQVRQQSEAAASERDPSDPIETGTPAAGSQAPLPAPSSVEPARSIAPARVESLALRPSADPSVILRAALRDEPWALMQVSGSIQQPSRVPAGQPMLMGRIWPRPGSPLPSRGFSALMRLELTAALAPAAISRALRPGDAPLPLTDEPLVFDLPHHRALVLSVPVESAPSRSRRSGPEVEKPPSLAEALLTTPSGDRIVLVLIPTLPGIFTLQDLAPPGTSSAPGVSSQASPPALNPPPQVQPPAKRQEPASVSPLMDR